MTLKFIIQFDFKKDWVVKIKQGCQKQNITFIKIKRKYVQPGRINNSIELIRDTYKIVHA